MRTTKREFVDQVRAHISSRISDENGETTKEALQNVVNEFNGWYSAFEQKRTPNKQEAFISFMLGLPSCFDIEFEYYRIRKNLEEWFSVCGERYNQKDDDKTASLYYHLITREFMKLCKQNEIEF